MFQFVNGDAVSIDRVPKSEKPDFRLMISFLNILSSVRPPPMLHNQSNDTRVVCFTVTGICLINGLAQLVGAHRSPGRNSLRTNHPYQRPYRERAATEPERVYLVARFIIAAQKCIEVLQDTLQPKSKSRPDDCKRPEPRGSHTIVVKGYQIVAGPQIQSLIEAPNICFENLRGAVARSIGQKNDVLGHGVAPAANLGYVDRKPL